MESISRSAIVPAEEAGQRFDAAAARLWPEFSRSRLQQWIVGGHLKIGGETAVPRARLRGGECLTLEVELEPVIEMAPEAIPIDIVHEDESIFVIDKPAGLVVHPGAGNQRGTLQNALLARDERLAAVPRAGIVHRLDKDTSGLLVVARTLTAQQALAAAIEARAIKRSYEAVCQGVLTGGGTIDEPLGRHPRERTRMAVRSDGRPSRTHYRVLTRFRAQTHIELDLETGRTHQIRVHMAHIRAPLVGDPVYGNRPRLPERPGERVTSALQGFRRQALHARRLGFEHPVSGEPLEFTSPLPADFSDLLDALAADAKPSE